MKAAIYARYSSEKQRDTSIDDQNRKCEQHAERERWDVVARFEDRGMSGTKRDRPGYQAMLAGAKARDFDVLLLDDQSRLSRDGVESETAFRRMEYWGVRIICLTDGYDSNAPRQARKIQRATKSLMNEMYLDDLADKTHRGVEGQVLKGYSGGGRAYGYTSEPIEDASNADRYGKPNIVGYRRKVDETKRPIVVDIFSMYADGLSCKQIARELNRLAIPSPAADWKRKHRSKRQDGKWMASTIYSMLDNEIYVGQVVWNRSQWVRDPDTGRRKRRSRPKSEWHRVGDSSLRIVSDALWSKVKARQRHISAENARLRESLRRGVLENHNVAGRKPGNFWSGLLVCGKCGRNYIKVSRYHYGCGSYANGGEYACGNSLRAVASVLDNKILTSIKSELLSEKRLRLMERTMLRYFEQRIAEIKAEGSRERIAKRITAVEAELSNVADAIAQVGMNQTLSAKLDALTREKLRLTAEQQAATTDPRLAKDIAQALPMLVRQNIALVEQLGTNKRKADSRMVARAQQAMEKLTGKIELNPSKGKRDPHLVATLELTGEHLALLAQEAAVSNTKQKQGAIKMVAGA